MNRLILRCLAAICCLALVQPAGAVRLKELSRIKGDRDYRLVGYGLVVGLAGTGDSEANRGTRISLANTLSHFQVSIRESELQSRNTAAVIVTATTGAFRETGDRLDVQVSSLGDARSLQGGTLVLTPLYGVDQRLYAFAQGPLTTGSYTFEANQTSVQKNHPTVGVIPRGATLERSVAGRLPVSADAPLSLLLNTPDMTTAVRMSNALAQLPELKNVRVAHAGHVQFEVTVPDERIPEVLARIESLDIEPDQPARVIINERTGTIVAGGDIVLGKAVISQEDLRIEINTEFEVSQPWAQFRPTDAIATTVVPQSEITLDQGAETQVTTIDRGATVLDLVNTLRKARVSTRSMIAIFQSLREAGALNAQLVVQ